MAAPVGSKIYVNTHAELAKHAAAPSIGNMTDLTYEEVQKRMKEIAKSAGITQPKIIIALKFKPGIDPAKIQEYCTPISDSHTWNQLKAAKDYYEFVPTVFVVDSNKVC